jgi:hypothetical protein
MTDEILTGEAAKKALYADWASRSPEYQERHFQTHARYLGQIEAGTHGVKPGTTVGWITRIEK